MLTLTFQTFFTSINTTSIGTTYRLSMSQFLITSWLDRCSQNMCSTLFARYHLWCHQITHCKCDVNCVLFCEAMKEQLSREVLRPANYFSDQCFWSSVLQLVALRVVWFGMKLEDWLICERWLCKKS